MPDAKQVLTEQPGFERMRYCQKTVIPMAEPLHVNGFP